MNPKILWVLAATALPPFASAQAQDAASLWTLQDENAAVSPQRPRDHFYTNGLRLGWTSSTTMAPERLIDLGRDLWGDCESRIGFDVAQRIDTPMDTGATIAAPRDQPYAGLLIGDFSLLSDTATTRRVLTISLGVAGPWAGGEEIQNGFHRLIHRPDVRGWSNQIPNTPAFELTHERIWRLPVASVAGIEADVLPSLATGVGDVRNYVQAGVTVRIGQGLGSDFGVPRPRPGLNGGDTFQPTRAFAWYVFAGADGQAVGYDLLLQSAPFRSGPHVSPVWDVAELQGGLAVMALGMRLTVAYVAQTPTFAGQRGGLHQFASASLSLRF